MMRSAASSSSARVAELSAPIRRRGAPLPGRARATRRVLGRRAGVSLLDRIDAPLLSMCPARAERSPNRWSVQRAIGRATGIRPASAGMDPGGAQVSQLEKFEKIDYFTDPSLVEDPYPYYEYLRSQAPVLPLPLYGGVVAVSGYDEAVEVYRDPDTFSSCNSVVGPFAVFPVRFEGDDIGETIARHRHQLPMHEHMVTMDPPQHTQHRAVLMKLITPKRLKENEEFMWRLADRQLDEFLARGRCEFISEYSQPFALLVIADLLGVPEADHPLFRSRLGSSPTPGQTSGEQT